jgi:DNA transformation protein
MAALKPVSNPGLDPDFIHELFAQFRPVAVKRMFGGAGILAEGLMFAILFDGVIYLRIDADSIADFEREGSTPFVYPHAKSPDRVGRPSQRFWRLPERLYDDPEELVVWAARSLAIAQRPKAAPRARARSKSPKPKSPKPKPPKPKPPKPKPPKSKSPKSEPPKSEPPKSEPAKSPSKKRTGRR